MSSTASSRFQTASLIAPPSYPNSVVWSEENLVAVASGHIITILNPAYLDGPRGLITLPASKPFSIGVVERESLLTSCLMPTCLSRGLRPCARSIAWSHVGVAPNSGCLLAVCMTDGRVKLYRSPFCEFSAEWVEVMDISDMLYDYFVSINFGEIDICPSKLQEETVDGSYIESRSASDLQYSVPSKMPKRSTRTSRTIIENTCIMKEQLSYIGNCNISEKDTNGINTEPNDRLMTTFTEVVTIPCSTFEQGSSVEVLKQDGSQRIWISGIIERVEVSKALVLFPEPIADGQQDDWVELYEATNKIEDTLVHNNITDNNDPLFPNLRPSMNLGNFPRQILQTECRALEEVLGKGQSVEAWLNNRWEEGSFMGFNGQGMLVKLPEATGCVTVDPTHVRLVPIWNPDLRSWQVTLIKIEVSNSRTREPIKNKSESFIGNNICGSFSVHKFAQKHVKRNRQSNGLTLITPLQYASRNAMLSSLIVAWSPVLQLSSESGPTLNISSSNCAILAVGGKSGKIALLRISEPQVYSIEHGGDSVGAILIGLLQAHNAWITAISWGLHSADASTQVLLATGSSDGSVKIWLGDAVGLIKSSGVSNSSFSLLKGVITADFVSVASLSLVVPGKSLDKILVAIGKGSGLLEVWTCHTASGELQNVGSHNKHNQVVTGLSWAFDGHCLYSCSQDNSVCSWVLREYALHEVPFPSSSPCQKSFNDMSHAFESCFGLALSPGNLVVAVVRSLDVDLLDQMYEARTQRAVVEFFWTGGQQLEGSSDPHHDCSIESLPIVSKSDLACWEFNILWSLKLYDHVCKPLVLWDVITALLDFKQSASKYVEQILSKWISSWLLGCHSQLSLEKILLCAPSLLSIASSRQMHLLNIICRRLMLLGVNADVLNARQHKLGGINASDEHEQPWIQLLVYSETELRQRLVAFTFAVVLSHASHPVTMPSISTWLPAGIEQMECWVSLNDDLVHDQLKLLKSEIGELRGRLHFLSEYVVEEKCSFCYASVPFESSEDAFCKGAECNSAAGQCHRLARCAISMQVCPTTSLWFCKCCRRWVSKLAPQTFFTMSKSPLDLMSLIRSTDLQEHPKALCPFCGILLQRLLPEFLLSPSPV
ncbi:hypothetical protein AAC387_Pa08g0609 [Persea americana]